MSVLYYNPSMRERLRYMFPGSETLEQNQSQAGQDLFVLSMLNGARNGTYLEIGIQFPKYISNSWVLEKDFGWRGVSIDIVADCVEEFHRERDNPAVVADATKCDYLKILRDAGITETDLDYASIDCEPADQTLQALYSLPLDDVRFAVITFEHDCYNAGPAVKQQSRDYLRSKGYELVVSNISERGTWTDFEDWWVHPELVDPALIKLFKADDDTIKPWTDYIYPC